MKKLPREKKKTVEDGKSKGGGINASGARIIIFRERVLSFYNIHSGGGGKIIPTKRIMN